ncbi:MAG: hypothetical protein ACE5JF_07030 [Anaerolineales bacterium]
MSEGNAPQKPMDSESYGEPGDNAEDRTSSEPEPIGESEEQLGSELAPASLPDEPMSSESEGESDHRTEAQIESERVEQEPPTEPSPLEVKEESRAGRFLRRVLRWTVALLVIFTLGVVAMEFVRVRPLADERNDLSQSLTEARTAQQDLEAELDRLVGVDAENQDLSEALLQTEARLALLNILVDVTRAQLALAQEDTVRVAAALQGTGEKLSSLRDLLGPSATTELDALRERLVLVLSEVDGDPFAAERDLEILANTLLEIEQGLAAE